MNNMRGMSGIYNFNPMKMQVNKHNVKIKDNTNGLDLNINTTNMNSVLLYGESINPFLDQAVQNIIRMNFCEKMLHQHVPRENRIVFEHNDDKGKRMTGLVNLHN